MPDPMPELATSLTVTETDRLLQAESAVRGFCGWHIAPEVADAALTVVGSGDRSIFLPTLWLTEVTSVVFVATAGEDEEVIDVDLVTWTRAGEVEVGTWWGSRRRRTATITFTHGHASVPPEISAVVIAAAQRAILNPKSQMREQIGPFSSTNSQTGAFGQAATLALLDAEKEILRRYRIPRSR